MTSEHRFASAADTVCVWDPSQLTRPFSKTPSDGTRHFTSVRWSDNGQLLVAANGSVSVIQVSGTDTSMLRLDTEDSDAVCACFAASSRQVLSGHRDTTVKMWNVKNKSVAKTLQGHLSGVTCLALSRGGSRLLSGSSGGDLICHSLTSNDTSEPMRTPSVESVTDVQFSVFTDSLAASSSQDGDVNIWDIGTQQLKKTFVQQHHGGAAGLAFSLLNEKLLASCGMDGKITFYDAVQPVPLMSKSADSPLSSVLIMPDGITVIAGSQTGCLYKYDLRSGTSDGLITMTKAHESTVASLSTHYATRHSGGGQRLGMWSKGSSGIADKAKTRPRKGSDPRNVSKDVAFSTCAVTLHRSAAMQVSSQNRQWTNEPATPLVSGAATQATKLSATVYSPESIFSPLATSSTMKQPRISPHNLAMFPTHPTPHHATKVSTHSPMPAMSEEINNVVSPLQSAIGSSVSSWTPLSTLNTVSSTQIAHPNVQPSSTVTSTVSSVMTQSSLQMPSTFSSLVTSSHGVSSFPTLPRQPLSSVVSGGVFSPLVELAGTEGRQPDVSSRLRSRNQLSSTVAEPQPESLTQTVAELHLDSQRQFTGSLDGVQSNDTLLATATVRPTVTSDCLTNVDRLHLVASAGNGATGTGSVAPTSSAPAPPQFHVQFFQSMIDDSLEELRLAVHRHIREVHVDIVRQFEQSEIRIQGMIERCSVNPALLDEIARLREENERLKRNY